MTGKCMWPRCNRLWYCTWLVDELAHRGWASCKYLSPKILSDFSDNLLKYPFVITPKRIERGTLCDKGVLPKNTKQRCQPGIKKKTSRSMICRVQTDKATILPHLQLLNWLKAVHYPLFSNIELYSHVRRQLINVSRSVLCYPFRSVQVEFTIRIDWHHHISNVSLQIKWQKNMTSPFPYYIIYFLYMYIHSNLLLLSRDNIDKFILYRSNLYNYITTEKHWIPIN